MNIDQPGAKALLETARRTLKDDVLPSVPRDKALEVLMAMRVMEIAGRALGESDDALETRQADRLRKLLGDDGDAATLAAQIRAGEWDDPGRARGLHEVLTADARDRLARLNPKYLAGVESEE